MSKLKPFNLEQALAGKPVVTRDGTPVTEIKFFETVSEPFPIVAIVSGRYERYTKDGKWGTSSNKFNEDLFMVPEKKTVWVNMYNSSITGKIEVGRTATYATEEDAKDTAGVAGHDYLGTYPIEIEL